MENLIKSTLTEIEAKFSDGELAYISLTGKNESFIRDNVSAILFKNKSLYGRESKRMDLVNFSKTINNFKADDIIEFTSLYTADILNQGIFQKYKTKILNDFEKNYKYIHNNTNAYVVIIATHPQKVIDNKYMVYVKYIRGINLLNNLYREDTERIITDCKNTLNVYFDEKKYIIAHHKINAGRAFETNVDLHFWIMKKIYCQCEDIETRRDGIAVAAKLLEEEDLVCNECNLFLKQQIN